MHEPINWSDFMPVGRELDYLQDAFRSGWVSGGAYVERLERMLDAEFPGSTSYAVANGTLAIQLALQALEVRPGDEVVVPAFCFQAASNVLRQLGAVPVFCDVDPLTWNQNVQTIAAAMTDRTVGIVVVHNYGASAPVDEIAHFARERGVWLLEDCAEAWFSRYRGRYVGQFGRLATFSMHATKPIACGEGGVVLSQDPELATKLRLLRSHGLDRSRAHYLHLLAGNNYRLSNLLAAVAYGQMECRDSIVADQARRLEWYSAGLRGHWAIQFQHALAEAADNIWAVAVRISFARLRITRDELVAELKSRGIETRPGFYPAARLEYHALAQGSCPVSEAVAAEVVALPCSPKLTPELVQRICSTLIEIVDGAARDPGGLQVEVLPKNDASVERVQRFTAAMREGRKAFRYFDKRPPEVVLGHAVTLLLSAGGRDVGYGHLEPEGNRTWLGIAVADDQRGQGWGKSLMHALLGEAASRGVPTVSLRVDRDNAAGIRLYRQFGFREAASEVEGSSLLMTKSVSSSRTLSAAAWR